MTTDDKKKCLRQKVKALLKKLSLSERMFQSRCIENFLYEQDFYRNADLILTYLPAESEVNLLSLIPRSFIDRKKIAVPRVVKNSSKMDFYFIDGSDENFLENQCHSGAFNIIEPDEKRPVFNIEASEDFTPEKILVLVPGLAFSKKGERLGHGKAYYDIYLKRLKAFCSKKGTSLTICGVCFDCQLLEEVPCDQRDFLMDKVLAPCLL